MTVGLIRDNFQEIYHAVQSKEGHGLALVANFSGTRIYDSTCGWGRLWRWFYRVADWLCVGNLRFEKLKSAIVYTHRQFQSQLPYIQKHVDKYETYLTAAGEGYRVDEEDCHASRRAITLWYTSYSPFIRSMKTLEHPKLERLFRLCFPDKDVEALWTCSAMESVEACHWMIDLEGIVQGPMPLEVFKKFLREKPLNAIDDRTLEKWVKKLNQNPSCVHIVHEAIKAISSRYISKKKEQKVGFADLERFLEDKGCEVFRQLDPEHISWRKQLKQKSEISMNGEKWILGSQIVSAKSKTENTLVFSLANHPQYIFLTAQNRAALGIRRCRQTLENGFGVEPAQMLDIFDDGRWAVMERLQPLNSRVWSRTNSCFNQEDQRILDQLAGLLSWLVKQKATPAHFSSEFIMFDRQYCLKALKPTTKQPFDFNALEDFAYQCAGGNLSAFQYLMTKSGLSRHPIAGFYHVLVEEALQGNATSVEDLACIYKIVDPKIVDRGIQLIHDLLALRDKLCLKARQEHPDRNLNEIEKDISGCILKRYRESKAAGIFWSA